MKKIFTLVALAGATALSASAQVLTPVPVELKNPSFEYSSLEGDETVAVKDNDVTPESGWNLAVSNTPWKFANYSKTDAGTGNKAGGNFFVRAQQGSINMDVPSTIYQDLLGPGPGTYVLSAAVCASRNGRRQEIGSNLISVANNQYGVLYVVDETSTDILYGQPGVGAVENCGNYMPRLYVVFHSESFLPQLQVGFSWAAPEGVTSIGKGGLYCDDFQLEYYPETAEMDPEEAIAAVSAQVKANVAASMDEAKKIAAEQKVYTYTDGSVHNIIGVSKLAFFGNIFGEDLKEDLATLNKIFETGEIPVTPPSGVEDIIASPVQDDNRYFNLQGIEVAEPTQPGLYIHNGKKILVK